MKQKIDSFKRRKKGGQRKVRIVKGYTRNVKSKKKQYIDVADEPEDSISVCEVK